MLGRLDNYPKVVFGFLMGWERDKGAKQRQMGRGSMTAEVSDTCLAGTCTPARTALAPLFPIVHPGPVIPYCLPVFNYMVSPPSAMADGFRSLLSAIEIPFPILP